MPIMSNQHLFIILYSFMFIKYVSIVDILVLKNYE